MPDERSFRRMLSSSERGELGFWPSTPSAVVATLIVTALIAMITDERIARRTAEGFLQGYYEQAVPAVERDHAWNMLVVSLQENPEKHPEGRKTYDWFDQWQRVQVEQVVSVAGEPNRFEANLTYISRETGRATLRRKTEFQLFCPWWTKKNPFRNCESEDIKIEDSFLKETSDG